MEYKQFKYKNLCEMTKFTALTIKKISKIELYSTQFKGTIIKVIKINFAPGLGAVQTLFFGLFQPNYIFCSPQSISSVIILHI